MFSEVKEMLEISLIYDGTFHKGSLVFNTILHETISKY